MNWQLENIWNILFLGILPIIGLLLFQFQRWRKRKQNLFAEQKFHFQIFEKRSFFSKIFPVLYLLAFSFFILSFINFINKEKEKISIPQKQNNLLFVVDISNSMNAQDVEPSRLEQAKEILRQSLNSLQDEKVGIIVFAGEAQSIMPLTTDYSSADIFLNNISSELIQKQGTDFLEAIKEANKKFKNTSSGIKKIILISDGEDNEGNHNSTIQEALNNEINITTIGIGTEEGSPIPKYLFNYYEDYKRDEYGQVIITQRQTSALKSIARKTNGQYIDGNITSEAVNNLMKDIQSYQKSTTENSITNLHTHYHYQWFLGISLFLFFIIYLFNPKKDFNF